MSSLIFLYSLVLSFVVSSASPKFTPVQINVKKAALDSLGSFLVDSLVKELPLKEFADIRDSRKVEDFGFIDYQLTDIKISFFGPQLPTSLPSWSLDLEPQDKLEFRLTGMEFKGHLTWNISANFGGFEMASCEELSLHASGMDVFLNFKLKTSEGRMKVLVEDCSCTVKDLKAEAKIFETLSFLKFSMGDMLKEEFENIVVKYSRNYIDNRNFVPNSFPFSESLQLLMVVVKDPLVTKDNLEVQSGLLLAMPGRGGTLPTNTEYERIPGLSSDRQISVILSENVCTENMKYLHEHGLLKYELKGNASSSNVFFDADCHSVLCFKSLFNKETKDIKNGFFEFSVEVTDLPSCSLKNKSLTFSGKFKFKVFFRSKKGKVETPSDSWQGDMSKGRNNEEQNGIKMFVKEKNEVRELFDFTFQVFAKISVNLKNESLYLKLGQLKANIDPNSIGMSSKRLEILLNGMAASLKGHHFNLNNFHPLRLENVELVIEDQFFQLNADLRVT